jgi:hypothetical protein
MRPWLWQEAFAAAAVDLDAILHQPYAPDATLPWEHMQVKRIETENLGDEPSRQACVF